MKNRTKIAPSILSADFSKLKDEIKSIEPYCDLLHVDVMDGHFVPNITIGPCVVKSIRKISKLEFDVHLMISEPEKYIESFAKAGADIITVHSEVKYPLLKLIKEIKKYGKKAGVSMNPDTEIDSIMPYIKDLDLILVMSVFPGFGGQKFMPEVLEKVKMLANARNINRTKNLLIEIDGGINEKTAKLAVKAGVDILVAGSYIFRSDNREKAIESLKKAQ
ncbi:ribulose-phosphate 3-epimerase [Candidatus Woesearchaeota archaeon]|nr:ribulose-phosphate 3-epimerase [Candidatus Woesearchaeota archaeon]